MLRWIDRYPERFEFELAEFRRRGLDFKLDEQHMAQTGHVLLRGSVRCREKHVELEVDYPDTFPFLRPEIFAPGLTLERHQNPAGGNLCLLERSTLAWSVSDTGAWLVAERVPHLLDLLEAGGETLRAGEAPQGEPASSYFKTRDGAAFFVPEEALHIPQEHRGGVLRLATGPAEPPQALLRACVSKVAVRDERRRKVTLAELSSPLKERFGGKTLDGRWVRLDSWPKGSLPRDLLAAAIAADPALETPRWQRLPDGTDISVIGIVVEEEVAQDVREDSWLFVAGTRAGSKGQMNIYAAAGERLTATDLLARLPARAQLVDRSVGVIGLGSLGAPTCGELLRAQLGELRLIDFDAVEAGNIVRWTHGLSAVGHRKTGVIGGWAIGDYPFTRVVGFDVRIGGVPSPAERQDGSLGEAEVLGRFFDGLSLVIDATGELGVQHLVATEAREQGIPQVYAWGTEGGWGGAVACIDGIRGPCWMCLQLAFDDDSIALPPAAPQASFQPRGCTDPTFRAAGFSMTPIAAQVARSATRLLAGSGSGTVHICALETPDGELPAPAWTSSPIPVHPACSCEHSRS